MFLVLPLQSKVLCLNFLQPRNNRQNFRFGLFLRTFAEIEPPTSPQITPGGSLNLINLLMSDQVFIQQY